METQDEGRETGAGANGVTDDVETGRGGEAATETVDLDAKRAAKEAERERLLAENTKELSAADILNIDDDLPTEWVPVPEWKGRVLVRALTGTERDRFESSIVKQKGKVRETNTENIRAKLCQLTIVDPTDPKKKATMFTAKQIDALGKRSAAALDRIYDVSARLSGLSNADVEELAGNSAAAGGDGS